MKFISKHYIIAFRGLIKFSHKKHMGIQILALKGLEPAVKLKYTSTAYVCPWHITKH
jgi:hypothetical protein